jgi:beta-lactam-binding protein with PASTA domain
LGRQWCLGAWLACALLFVSGCAKMTVPNVEGLTQDAATTAITAAKLTVGSVTQQSSNTVATGKVISQDPASGSSLGQGSPVSLVISSGPPMVTVPNVGGLTQAAATTVTLHEIRRLGEYGPVCCTKLGDSANELHLIRRFAILCTLRDFSWKK